MKYSLNGCWKVTHIEHQQDLSSMLTENFVPEGFLTAFVPEQIHATLRRYGIILGNTFDKEESADQWIEEADWIYYKEFYIPETWKLSQVTLHLQGLDTFCEIYLNGQKVGFSQNMHVPCSIDVRNLLQYNSRNVILLRFFSPVKFVADREQDGLFSITTSERLFARKAQMNYSWDFCGRCVSVGIWKDVFIESVDDPQITDYYIQTEEISEHRAQIGLLVNTDTLTCGNDPDLHLSFCLSLDGKEVIQADQPPAYFASAKFTVENPQLWWPRPYGDPVLYDMTLTLYHKDKVIDQKTQKFGIRTVSIIQELQEDGKSFIFSVNGRRLFIRGANWVPLNTVYTDIKDTDYDTLLDYAAHGNISMLRIWGGGIYESDHMFDLCDRLGIMIWNDFMLSCGIYPQDEDFLSLISAEADYVVKKYRNYTSLVLWTGDNENGQAYGWAGRPYEFADEKIGNQVISQVCRRLDPMRNYFPTSPCSPDPLFRGGDNPASPSQGDVHLYIMSADPGINAHRDYGKNYYKRVTGYKPRFMSEFGFISMPEKDSFFRYNFRRSQIPCPNELTEFLPFTDAYMSQTDHEKTIYYSQVYNSMALQYWIEYFRSLKWTCAGSLYWKFNDPVADRAKEGIFPTHMSVIDMYHLPKMTYYYTRRAYEDVIVLCTDTEKGIAIYVCSEDTADMDGRLTVTHMDFDGRSLNSFDCTARAFADASTLLMTLAKEDISPRSKFHEYLLIQWKTAGKTYVTRKLFADICEINQLQLPPVSMQISAILSTDKDQQIPEKIVVTLKTDVYARHVRLHILDIPAHYSDNYMDMDADTEREIVIQFQKPDNIPVSMEKLMQTVLYVEAENMERTVLPICRFHTRDCQKG